jgi:succinylglutamate desuccinylase
MEGVTQKKGLKPGKTVAIFGGVHGNERVGVEAVRWAAENLTPERGTVYFVEANPEAIEKNVRLIGKNLNRCFLRGNTGDAPEDRRARELMALLDECDALLDIHSTISREATPFIICEKDAFPLAKQLDFPIISAGWDALEPGGTDGYMFNRGKVGICIECGSVFDSKAQEARARSSVVRFLAYFGVIPELEAAPNSARKKLVRVYRVGHKKSEDVSFLRDYADFEPLAAGEVFARDGDIEYKANAGDCIIFPHANGPVGSEIFLIGKQMPGF